MHHLVTIARPDDQAAVEVAIDGFWIAGAVGVEELGATIRAAFTDAETAGRVAADHDGAVESVDDTTGLDEWRDHAESYRAGAFHLRPPWHPEADDGIDLVVDPGHAFGSGSHPTTRLVLAALDQVIRPGDHVLDLGTGSGVLAIAAAMLGATVDAVDIDPAAQPAVVANAAANDVADRITVHIGDIAELDLDRADVVLLNVTIDIHEFVAETVRAFDADRLVIAGVLAGEQAERAARLHGRTPTATTVEGEWASLVFDHGRSAPAS